MDKDIVMSHVSIIGFHMVSVLLGETVITFNAGPKFLEPIIKPWARHSWSSSAIVVFEISISHPAKATFGVLILAREKQSLRVIETGVMTSELTPPMIILDSSAPGGITKETERGSGMASLRSPLHRSLTDDDGQKLQLGIYLAVEFFCIISRVEDDTDKGKLRITSDSCVQKW